MGSLLQADARRQWGLCLLLACVIVFPRPCGAAEAVDIPSVWQRAGEVPRPADERGKAWENASAFRLTGGIGVMETPDALFLRSPETSIALSRKSGGILSILHTPNRTDLLSCPPERPILWEIELRTKEGTTVTWNSADAQGLELTWLALDTGVEVQADWPLQEVGSDLRGRIGVRVRGIIRPDEPRTRWQIQVENQLEDAGLWWVRFPILEAPGYAGASDVMAEQQLFRQLSEEVSGQFWSLQFISMTCGDATLYLAAEDAAQHWKSYRIDPAKRFEMEILPPHASEPKKGYTQEFDFVIAAIKGDWFDAASLYRQWAQEQEWYTAAPLASRRQTPGEFNRTCLWLTAMSPMNRDPDEVLRCTLKAKEFFGVPVGIHWYGWAKAGPCIAPMLGPAREGFAEAVRRATSEGIAAMPYMSMLYSIRNAKGEEQVLPGFEALRLSACRPLPGSDMGRQWNGCYLVGVNKWWMVPMCRCTASWQDCIAGAVKYLHDECEVRSVYLDMAQVQCRWPCFAAEHSHTPGGGNYWTQGSIAMLKKIRSAVGENIAISGEGRCEAFIPYFDMDLIGGWPGSRNCPPVYEAVYGDRRLSFASLMPGDGTQAAVVKAGMRLLQGAQLRIGFWILDEEQRPLAEFIRRLLTLKSSCDAFLSDGQLLRAPSWVEEPGRIRCPQWMAGKRGGVVNVSFPAMERAAWRSPDGKAGVFVVNFDEAPHEARLQLEDGRRVSAPIPPRDVKLIVIE